MSVNVTTNDNGDGSGDRNSSENGNENTSERENGNECANDCGNECANDCANDCGNESSDASVSEGGNLYEELGTKASSKLIDDELSDERLYELELQRYYYISYKNNKELARGQKIKGTNFIEINRAILFSAEEIVEYLLKSTFSLDEMAIFDADELQGIMKTTCGVFVEKCIVRKELQSRFYISEVFINFITEVLRRALVFNPKTNQYDENNRLIDTFVYLVFGLCTKSSLQNYKIRFSVLTKIIYLCLVSPYLFSEEIHVLLEKYPQGYHIGLDYCRLTFRYITETTGIYSESYRISPKALIGEFDFYEKFLDNGTIEQLKKAEEEYEDFYNNSRKLQDDITNYVPLTLPKLQQSLQVLAATYIRKRIDEYFETNVPIEKRKQMIEFLSAGPLPIENIFTESMSEPKFALFYKKMEILDLSFDEWMAFMKEHGHKRLIYFENDSNNCFQNELYAILNDIRHNDLSKKTEFLINEGFFINENRYIALTHYDKIMTYWNAFGKISFDLFYALLMTPADADTNNLPLNILTLKERERLISLAPLEILQKYKNNLFKEEISFAESLLGKNTDLKVGLPKLEIKEMTIQKHDNLCILLSIRDILEIGTNYLISAFFTNNIKLWHVLCIKNSFLYNDDCADELFVDIIFRRNLDQPYEILYNGRYFKTKNRAKWFIRYVLLDIISRFCRIKTSEEEFYLDDKQFEMLPEGTEFMDPPYTREEYAKNALCYYKPLVEQIYNSLTEIDERERCAGFLADLEQILDIKTDMKEISLYRDHYSKKTVEQILEEPPNTDKLNFVKQFSVRVMFRIEEILKRVCVFISTNHKDMWEHMLPFLLQKLRNSGHIQDSYFSRIFKEFNQAYKKKSEEIYSSCETHRLMLTLKNLIEDPQTHEKIKKFINSLDESDVPFREQNEKEEQTETKTSVAFTPEVKITKKTNSNGDVVVYYGDFPIGLPFVNLKSVIDKAVLDEVFRDKDIVIGIIDKTTF